MSRQYPSDLLSELELARLAVIPDLLNAEIASWSPIRGWCNVIVRKSEENTTNALPDS
jgi:hypothetical protein